ncbi:hypothetical protein LLG96_10175 [bacterium]|nr:hypothetical protein [bacterium]
MKKMTVPAMLVWISCITYSHAQTVNTRDFIDKASISYKTSFTIDATLDMWNRILNNPYLIGKLWEVYDFTPRYKVSMKGAALHVIDPTGIEGDLFVIQSDENNKVFYARGKLKNWGIPISLMGKVLFLLNYTGNQNSVSVTLNIYGEGGDNIVASLLLKAVSPILSRYINRRVTSNVRDLKIIVADIVNNPDKIRVSLNGDILEDFNRLYH